MAKNFKLVFCEHFRAEQILCRSDSLSELLREASCHLSLYEDLETFLRCCDYFEIDDCDDNCLISLQFLLLESKDSFSLFKLSESFH